MHRPLLITMALVAATFGLTTADAAGADAASAGYRPLPAPQRLLDTRVGEPTADGAFAGVGKRPAGSTLELAVAGRAGLATDVASVVLNVTVDQPDAPGHVTVWPCDQGRPATSNLNYVTGQTVAVAAISRVAGTGTVCLSSLAGAHLIVDVAGSFAADGFAALAAPQRLADSRPGEGTVDGAFAGAGRRGAGSTWRVRVAGRGGVPAGATSVALNVTATDIAEPGFVTVYPCDAPRPTASNLNYSAGVTTPNAVLTRLDANGDVCVYTLAGVHLIVDVAGVLPADVFQPLAVPSRLLDTRAGEPTVDGAFAGGGAQPAGSSLQLAAAGRAGIPEGVSAVVLNVTSTSGTEPGFITAHPQGSKLPSASNLNVTDGRTVANLVVAALGPTGDVCLFNRGGTDLVVDVAGWLTGSAPDPAATASCPSRRSIAAVGTYRDAMVRRPQMHRVVGTDRIALYICEIPADTTAFGDTPPPDNDATPENFAALANAQVSPYLADMSGGRLRVEFTAVGSFAVGRADGPGACLSEAISRTGEPFTGVLVAGSVDTGGGYASPGTIFTGGPNVNLTIFDRVPAESGRGGWVGGVAITTYPDAGTIAHEVGHMLHWPHSFITPGDEYDNPVDMMSAGFGFCDTGTVRYRCEPSNTIAFNRLAAGWLSDGQAVTQPSGTVNYLLDRPGAAGLQVVGLPDPAQPLSMLTVEARPAVGNDDVLAAEGVAVHAVDQLDRTGGISGLSTRRRQRQAFGAPDSYDHVLDVGEQATVAGVTVRVLRRTGDRYEVQISGTYRMPGNSYFAESVIADHQNCSTLDIARALAAGCDR